MLDPNDGRCGLTPGTIISKYRIEKVIGYGGDAIVYAAICEQEKREVVLKEFFPSNLAVRDRNGLVRPCPEVQKRTLTRRIDSFIQEARLLEKLSHPNLIKCYDRFECMGTGFLVLQRETGETVEQLMGGNNNSMDIDRWWAIACDILKVLDKIHRTGFLHCDLSPQNILLRYSGEAVLLDLGTARGLSDATAPIMVTRDYCAIEMISGHVPPNPSSDLFALGAVMYHAIEGRLCTPATARIDGKEWRPLALSAQTNFEFRFFSAIDASMHIEQINRPQSVLEFWALLGSSAHLAERHTTSAPAHLFSGNYHQAVKPLFGER